MPTPARASMLLLPALRAGRVHEAVDLLDEGATKGEGESGKLVGDWNAGDGDGWTALLFAASKGMHTVVEKLLEKGADPMRKLVKSGNTALHLASLEGHIGIVKLLLKKGTGADPAACNLNNDTPLMFAGARGNLGVIALLLHAGAKAESTNAEGMSSLMVAAASGASECVKALLRVAPASAVNATDVHGRSALHYAAGSGHTACAAALLEAGADAALRDALGHTPLSEARQSGHRECARVLEVALDARQETDAEATPKAGTEGAKAQPSPVGSKAGAKKHSPAGVKAGAKQPSSAGIKKSGSGRDLSSHLAHVEGEKRMFEQILGAAAAGKIAVAEGGRRSGGTSSPASPSSPHTPEGGAGAGAGRGSASSGSPGSPRKSPGGGSGAVPIVVARLPLPDNPGARAAAFGSPLATSPLSDELEEREEGGEWEVEERGEGGEWEVVGKSKRGGGRVVAAEATAGRGGGGAKAKPPPPRRKLDTEGAAPAPPPVAAAAAAAAALAPRAPPGRAWGKPPLATAPPDGPAAARAGAAGSEAEWGELEVEGKEEEESGEPWEFPAEVMGWLVEHHPHAAAVDVHPEHILGRALGALSMSQLEALEEIHRSALLQLEEARIDLARRHERALVREEVLRAAEIASLEL